MFVFYLVSTSQEFVSDSFQGWQGYCPTQSCMKSNKEVLMKKKIKDLELIDAVYSHETQTHFFFLECTLKIFQPSPNPNSDSWSSCYNQNLLGEFKNKHFSKNCQLLLCIYYVCSRGREGRCELSHTCVSLRITS